ncbi:MAG: two-component regulator propeller domain-containing protein [Chloroflexota bacterium]
MDQKPKASKTLRTSLISISTFVIVGLFGLTGYFIVQTLPVFYSSPSPASRVTLSSLPTPSVTNGNWRSWTTTKHVNDALWANDLLWLATDGGLVTQDVNSGEWVKFLPEHGLPSGSVSTVTADATGKIWIGTRDSGVARYDGSRWISYRGRDEILSDRIRDLYADSKGVVWAATASGVARYDGDTWSTVRFSLFDIVSPPVNAITGTGDAVWAATERGVYHFNGSDWFFYGLNEGVINEQILDITIAPNGTVWIATPSGIGQFDGTRWNRFTVKDGLPDLPATDILAAPDNTVWITFENQENLVKSQTFRFDGAAPVVVFEGGVNRLTQQSGNVWVASNVGYFQPRAGVIQDQIVLADDFPHASLTSFARLDQGVALAGDAGVSLLSELNGDWQTFALQSASALTFAEDGRIALSGKFPADGVMLVDTAGNVEHLECRTAGMNVGRLYAMTESTDGALWFLGNESVGRLQNGAWEYFVDGLPPEYSARKIETDYEGNIWLGLDVGLFRLNSETRGWDLIDGRTVQRMATSVNGNLWLVMENQLIHLVGDQFIPINNPPLDDITGGFAANSDGLWISSSNGIAQLLPDTAGDWVIHTINNGLSTNDVTVLTVDPNDQLWVGYGDPRFGFSTFRDGEWTFIHNIIDPDAVNGGHISLNAPRRNEVVDMTVTSDQQVWYGTYFAEIGRLAEDELLYRPNDYRLYFEGITQLHTSSDGSVWVAGWEGRLARLLPEENVAPGAEPWLFYQRELSTAKVQEVVMKDGKAWLGTDQGVAVIDNGICRMIPHRETLDVVAGNISPDGGSIWWATRNNGGLELDLATEKLDWTILHLRGRTFNDLTRAADDALWFVSDYELVRVDGDNRRVVELENFGSVTAVASGLDLRPWIATDRGISTLRGENWLTLSTADGLLSNEIIDMLIEPDGTIWVLSKSGLSQFAP